MQKQMIKNSAAPAALPNVASEAFKKVTPKFTEKKKELEQLANSLDENDNPVEMVVWLK